MTTWRKSSYSGSSDSKAPATHLTVSSAAWSAFLKLTLDAPRR